MAVYSMTGYASVQQVGKNAESEEGPTAPATASFGFEIRSVNSRFLDLLLRLPEALREHEPQLRQLLAARLRRGKVELRVTTAAPAADAGAALPSPRQLHRLATLQDLVRGWLPQAAPLSVAEVLRLCDGAPDAAPIAADELHELARQAVDALQDARAAEGARLAAALLGCVAALRRLAEQAEPLLPQLVEQARQRFLQRWSDALADTDGTVPPPAAQERALAESTAFALRIDVAEELTRLGSHLDEIEQRLHAGGEVGKRLEFLIQELQREANTLGSKSAALELSRIAVDMKVLIEQMREQVQNLE